MGRQPVLARLALGRSPFGQVLRDDDGEMILGPHTQNDHDQDYRQMFSQNGHPENTTSQQAARRLRRAQNEVLETIGVVVRKASQSKNQWQRMSDEKKLTVLFNENMLGLRLRFYDHIGLFGSCWWAHSLRRRILIYRYFSTMPLTQAISMEWRKHGPFAFISAGMPLGFLTALSRSLRSGLGTETEPTVDLMIPKNKRFALDWFHTCLFFFSNMAWFGLELPLQSFVYLRSLNLITTRTLPEPQTFLPFSSLSPIQPIPLPVDWSALSLIRFGTSVLTSPFVLGLFLDYIRYHSTRTIYLLIRQSALKPTGPLRLSILAADQDDLFEETTLPELGVETGSGQRRYGPDTFKETMHALFPTMFRLWNRLILRRWEHLKDTNSDPDLNDMPVFFNFDELQDAARSHEMFVDQSLTDPVLLPNVQQSIERDVDTAQHGADLVLDEPAVSANDTYIPTVTLRDGDDLDDNNTTNIEAQYILDVNIPVLHMGPSGLLSVDELDTTNDELIAVIDDLPPRTTDEISFQPAIALETLLEAADPPPQTAQPDQHPSPTPGIIRAPSLTQTMLPPVRRASAPPLLEHAMPQPVRRATAVSDDLEYATLDLEAPRRSKLSRMQAKDSMGCRITLLSCHPADAFAWHSSLVLVNALLLPLEMVFVRVIARGYLNQNRPSSISVIPGLWPTFWWPAWRPGSLAESGAFCLNLLATFGLEAITSFAVWRIGAGIALYSGRRMGWSHF